MRNFETVTAPTHQLVSITCDRCGHTTDDVLQMQEFVSVGDTAGYGSKFWGDLRTWAVDLCEGCAYALLASYARYPDDNGN